MALRTAQAKTSTVLSKQHLGAGLPAEDTH